MIRSFYWTKVLSSISHLVHFIKHLLSSIRVWLDSSRLALDVIDWLLTLSHRFTNLLLLLICLLSFLDSFFSLLYEFVACDQLVCVFEQNIAVDEFKGYNDGHSSNAKYNHVLAHEECAFIHSSSMVQFTIVFQIFTVRHRLVIAVKVSHAYNGDDALDYEC